MQPNVILILGFSDIPVLDTWGFTLAAYTRMLRSLFHWLAANRQPIRRRVSKSLQTNIDRSSCLVIASGVMRQDTIGDFIEVFRLMCLPVYGSGITALNRTTAEQRINNIIHHIPWNIYTNRWNIVWFWLYCFLWLQVMYLLIYFRVTSLALGQWNNHEGSVYNWQVPKLQQRTTKCELYALFLGCTLRFNDRGMKASRTFLLNNNTCIK